MPLFPTIGIPELLIVLVIVLIFFGVGKLPEIGRALGSGIKQFKDAQGSGESPPDRAHRAIDAREPEDAVEVREKERASRDDS